ncbi:hypothetical protein [Planobispora takensis]|uniref:hypothetical protein n=1 Tax=Planobispora takensis TaxID=1367882 RepID=UPI001942CF60|nr:hypothetical protein [Planobispora takensis]
MTLFTCLLIVAVITAVIIVLRRRRRARAAASQVADVRPPDPAGSHDRGVEVDEEAWAEIVRYLKKEGIRDEPGDGRPAGGPR